ncbi:PREDICTED: uncharacterized protein LOC109585502 [Amphimedon queenslandica]|uniref:Uncharacterized protein n=1 Tax=Amphimedon queenslandica TaxID=400682 RepID=A0AAN0JJL8_AMPQE|nr:PREDICTED: uncharacterized protein LOC109585502 [Amphimedon queenslandica]|eukprot:XP_019857174.1 PREDICTED: uncharacterized protein LOC109585502 [Amphimedon queenslandica]
MIKTDSLKRTILQELNVSNEQNLNLEIISQTAVSVNGMVFEQLPVQSLQAIVSIRDIERERLSKQPPTQPSIPSYSARVNTLPPLKVEAQKTNHTSSLLPNNQSLPLQKAPLVPSIKPSSLPKIKPQIQKSSSSSSSDSEDDKAIPVVSSNNVACPPPLNDIPHVLPRVLPLKQSQTDGLLPPANAVLKPIKPLRSRLHSPTPKASIKVEPSLSSSSSTSISKDQPKKRHRRRKSKLAKSNRSPSPVKHQTTTSSSDDEDTFDPSITFIF